MLALRPNCENCNRDLPADSTEARICSYECTFCADCAQGVLCNVCPNCGGELVRRPVRPAERRALHPPSAQRVISPLTGDKLARHAEYVRRYAHVEPAKR